jgi:hypothetical protein
MWNALAKLTAGVVAILVIPRTQAGVANASGFKLNGRCYDRVILDHGFDNLTSS